MLMSSHRPIPIVLYNMFSSSEQMVVKGLLMAGVKMNLRQVEQDFSSFFAKSLAYVFDDFSKFHSTFRYQICHNTRASHLSLIHI